MRGVLPGILVGGLLLAGPVMAQPAEMTVVVPTVEVRSGPTLQYYATGRLRQGDRVTVVNDGKAQPGWLAVKPPPGSFSWINARFVKQEGPHSGVVMGAEEAPVMPGSSVTNKAPNVEQVKVKPGFIVAILDRPLQAEGGTWLPIVPPPGEVRYIPAEAVGGSGVRPGPGGVAPAGLSNALLAQADQAYLAGNLEQAKKLYKEAADKTSDQGQKIYCYNRLATLQKGSWSPPPPQVASLPRQNTAPPAPPVSGPAPPIARTAPPAQAQTTSLYGHGGLPAHPTQWSPWGQLRRTAFVKDGQPMYVLENRQGQPLLYVTNSPGVSLQPYLGQTISLFGTVMYRSDDYLRAHYLVASHVALP